MFQLLLIRCNWHGPRRRYSLGGFCQHLIGDGEQLHDPLVQVEVLQSLEEVRVAADGRALMVNVWLGGRGDTHRHRQGTHTNTGNTYKYREHIHIQGTHTHTHTGNTYKYGQPRTQIHTSMEHRHRHTRKTYTDRHGTQT